MMIVIDVNRIRSINHDAYTPTCYCGSSASTSEPRDRMFRFRLSESTLPCCCRCRCSAQTSPEDRTDSGASNVRRRPLQPSVVEATAVVGSPLTGRSALVSSTWPDGFETRPEVLNKYTFVAQTFSPSFNKI